MRSDNRGEGGFMESMMAVMIIIITLTAFISLLAFSTSHHSERDIGIPSNIFDDVCIVDGNIEAPVEERMKDTAERYGYQGMTVILTSADPFYDSEMTITVGSSDTDRIWSASGTMIVGTDDGRSVPVNYSVAVWY